MRALVGGSGCAEDCSQHHESSQSAGINLMHSALNIASKLAIRSLATKLFEQPTGWTESSTL